MHVVSCAVWEGGEQVGAAFTKSDFLKNFLKTWQENYKNINIPKIWVVGFNESIILYLVLFCILEYFFT